MGPMPVPTPALLGCVEVCGASPEGSFVPVKKPLLAPDSAGPNDALGCDR